jgi:hypothetical protein
VTRRSDSAHSFLETALRKQYEEFRGYPVDYTDPEVIRQSRYTRQQLRDFRTHPAETRYEPPPFVVVTKTYAALVEQAARDLSFRFESPLVVVAGSRRMSGATFLVPGTQTPVLMYEGEIVMMVARLSRVVAQCIPAEQQDDIARYDFAAAGRDQARITAASPAYGDLVVSYLEHATVEDAPIPSVEPIHEWTVGALRSAMHLFVLGHEYAHVICNHIGATGWRPLDLLAAEVDNDLGLDRAGWQELEADLLGLRLAVAACPSAEVAPALALAGAELYLTIQELIGVSVYATTEPNMPVWDWSGLYPELELRRACVREWISALLPDQATTDNALAVSGGLDQACRGMQQAIAGRLERLFRRRLAGRWRPANGAGLMWKYYEPGPSLLGRTRSDRLR